MIRFFDTNSLLNMQEKLFDDYFYISSISLNELEDIKVSRNKDEDVKNRCRKVLKLLAKNEDKYEVIIYDQKIATLLSSFGLEPTPDNKICACAASKINEVKFVTEDIACRLIAKNIFGLEVYNPNDIYEKIYKGYKLLKGNTAEINEALSNAEYMSKFVANEYLLIYNTDVDNESEMRFDGEKFVNLKLPNSRYIKGKNALQRCALDMLNNQNISICAVLGGMGSGKSFVCTRMALYNVKEKGNQSMILGVRSPMGEGKEIGFLPGDFESKTDAFFLPIEQQLDGGAFELASLKQQGIIDANIPLYMKGTTYNSTIMVVDEAEDLTGKELRLVGTRLGENSRIFLSGDYKQAVVHANENNALVQMCNKFKGNSHFGCIYLDEDVRSETSKMFAGLLD